MAHFAYPAGTPTGVVPFGYVVPSTDWATVIASLFKSINGDEGGTWAPGAFITIGGFGLNLTGTGHTIAASARVSVASTGEIRVLSGASLTIQSGGALDVSGAGSIKSGGNLNAESGSTVTISSGASLTAASGSTTNLTGTTLVRGAMTIRASGGPGTLNVETGCTVTAESGSLFNVYTALAKVQSGGKVSFLNGSELVSEGTATAVWTGSWTFASDTWPLLSPARAITRRTHRIAWNTYNDGDTTGPTAPDAYMEISDMGSAPCIRTRLATAATVAGPKHAVEFDDLPAGATLTSVAITTKGLGTDPSWYTRFVLVKWQGGDANYTGLSALAVDEHSSSGNWTTTTDVTTVTPSSTVTIDKSWHYGVVVFHPYSAGGSATLIYDVVATLSLASLQH